MEETEGWCDEIIQTHMSINTGGPSPAQWSVDDTPSGMSSNASSARRPSAANGGMGGNASTNSTSRTNGRVWRRKYAYDPWTKRPVVMGVTQRRFWCWETSSSGWWIGFTFLVRTRTTSLAVVWLCCTHIGLHYVMYAWMYMHTHTH